MGATSGLREDLPEKKKTANLFSGLKGKFMQKIYDQYDGAIAELHNRKDAAEAKLSAELKAAHEKVARDTSHELMKLADSLESRIANRVKKIKPFRAKDLDEKGRYASAASPALVFKLDIFPVVDIRGVYCDIFPEDLKVLEGYRKLHEVCERNDIRVTVESRLKEDDSIPFYARKRNKKEHGEFLLEVRVDMEFEYKRSKDAYFFQRTNEVTTTAENSPSTGTRHDGSSPLFPKVTTLKSCGGPMHVRTETFGGPQLPS